MSDERLSFPYPIDGPMDQQDLFNYLAKANLGNAVWVGPHEVEPLGSHISAEEVYPVHVTNPNPDLGGEDTIVFETYGDVGRVRVYEFDDTQWSINFPVRDGLRSLDDIEPVVVEEGDRPPVRTSYIEGNEE